MIANFNFSGGSFASSDASTDWTTTTLGTGGGVPLATDAVVGNPAPSLALSMGDINDGTFLDNDYYKFIVTPNPTMVLDYTQFSFDINKISGGAAVNYLVFSSIDGFTLSNELSSGAITATNSFSTESFSVSSLSSVTTATEFRIYLDTVGSFGANPIRIDNINLTGTVVPEPSAALLSGIGMLLLLRRRHRR